jgi:Ca2+-binding RTX toxin-like protein
MAKGKNTRNRKQRSRRRSVWHYGELEPRALLAGISFDGATGVVLIDGTSHADTVEITPHNGQVTVNFVNIDQQTFAANSVSAFRFLGRSGNDRFVNNTNIDSFAYGHAGDDVLIGGDGNDRFQGGDGNDTLKGMGANDLLQGNDGHDTIYGGNQHDRIRGGAGDDIIYGESGRDHLSGNSGNDRIEGGDEKDRLFGLLGDDLLIGGDGADRIEGGPGIDILEGGNGADRLFGQEGNDTIRGGDGDDLIYGDDGDDNIVGNSGDDQIFGGAGEDTIRGDAGDDLINLGSATDRAAYIAAMSNYSSSQSGSTIVVEDRRSNGEGRDTLIGAEWFRFADGDRTPNQLPANLNDAEQESLRLLNQLRTNRGVGALSAATDISRYARNWAQEMSRTGFRHSPSQSLVQLLVNGRTLIAENIIFYGDPSLSAAEAARFFHQQWVNSPTHFEHMVDGRFTEVGVGLYRAASGWFGTHVFTNG